MKIVFFGTPEFAVASLDALIKAGHEVAAVVTATDKPGRRGHKLIQSAVKEYALSRGLPVLQPEKLRDEAFLSRLRAIGADLFVVIAFRMLPEAVWAMPPKGTFNLHASLLPRYRGAAPINRAIMNGDTTTGVTTFFISHDIDTGDIIDRAQVPILPEDNAGTLHDRLMELGATLTVKTVNALQQGSVKTTPQELLCGNEPATPAPKIFKEDCELRWERPAAELHNRVRGLSPYPGAWFTMRAHGMEPTDIKVFETAVTDEPSTDAPGTVHTAAGRLLIDTATTRLQILSLQSPGKRRMDATAWLRGTRL